MGVRGGALALSWLIGTAWPVVPSVAQPGATDAPAAQTVVSAAPDKVAVTIYRAPERGVREPLSPDWLRGYALITEDRDVDLPAGQAVLRFEGVAAGMLAESAIIGGLPAGVHEKNLDADLLSPRNLYARAFGRPVVLRRRHPGSGQVEEVPAIIRSGPDGAAVVQTRAGFEAVNCGGLRDSIAYQGLPPGLNSRPTLSVQTSSDAPRRVRVRLSYLAWGFDWQAHYVLALAPGAQTATMTAWLTLASGDDTGFPDATASVVAGKPHFDERRDEPDGDQDLRLECSAPPPPVMMAPPPVSSVMAAPMAITVTAARRMMKADYAAVPEALGDLHLYRIPAATTVAAHAQKQVALLTDRKVRLALIHAAVVVPGERDGAQRLVRLRNRREDGLGLALPSGVVSVLQPLGRAAIPAGEGAMADKAEGEIIDIALGVSPTVQVASTVTAQGKGRRAVRVTVTNANRWPVRFEGKLALEAGEVVAASSERLGRKDGLPLWQAQVPARGKAVLTYTLSEGAKPAR